MPAARVLHIITRLANGGAAENTIYTVNGLDRDRFAVDLVIGGSPNDKETDQVEKLAIANDVGVYRVSTLTRNPGVGELRALREIRSLIRRGGYQVVHTHGAKAGILGRIAAHRERVPVIINGVHGHTFSPQMNPIARPIYRTIERRVARYTTHFVSVGADLRTQYLDAGVGTPDRFSVIHSGMDLTRFLAVSDSTRAERESIRRDLGVPPDAVVFANISRMEPRKGHRFFLEAAAQMTAGDSWFVIVGDGPEEDALRRQAGVLGIEDRLVFTGYRGDVELMFSMSDAVVLTSLWEGLPRVLVQAAASSRAAISFACDGAHEIISDDKNGWIVPMKDVGAVADRMDRLAKDPDLRESMGRAGRAQVNESWTVESMVQSIESLYEQLIANH